MPDREQLCQKVGRGNRAGGNYIGTVYHVANPQLASSHELAMKKATVFDWQNGAINLRLINAISGKIGTSK
jgi:hypothetical protein